MDATQSNIIFDLQAWMRGEIEAPKSNPESIKIYYYGLHYTKSNKIASFLTRSLEETKKLGKIIYCKETNNSNEAQNAVNKLIERLKNDSLSILLEIEQIKPKEEFNPIGNVGQHSDRFGSHLFLCVGIYNDRLLLLFFTSSIKWNKFARRITKDEAALSCYIYSKTTYFAPVIRFDNNITWFDLKFPEHRIQDLYQEFFENNLEQIKLF